MLATSIRHSFGRCTTTATAFVLPTSSSRPLIIVRAYRSDEWFAKADQEGFTHRSLLKSNGWPNHLVDGRPVIGIASAWSELAPSNAHLKQVGEFVKRGIWESGGFPLEFPVTSIGESIMKPTSMLYRNLMAMDVEESIRANPVDGVVLLAGCSKTTPAMLMGAASCDLPTILVSGGPMLNGKFRGKDIGSGTDVLKVIAELGPDKSTPETFEDAEYSFSRSYGHTNTMGTASTMACATESLGISLPQNGAIPAVDARRNTLAYLSGKRIVELVKDDIKMSKILTRKAFENAIKVNAALGGSANFIIHMLAIAGRLSVLLDIDDFHRFAKDIPVVANLKPNGKYLMEDFYYAGGVPAVMHEIKDKLNLDQPTVNGRTLGENLAKAECYNREVIKTAAEPLLKAPYFTIIRGNMARLGCIVKTNQISPHLMKTRGRALVFDSVDEYLSKALDPDFEVHETNVMIIRNAGPKGYPGMGEVPFLPVPKKILNKGIVDCVRITDARMTNAATGTILFHNCPEAAVGGTISIIRNGDMIDIDVENQKIHLSVSKEEIQERLKKWRPPLIPEPYKRGYVKLYLDHVTQVDKGADFDFLAGKSGTPPLKDSY